MNAGKIRFYTMKDKSLKIEKKEKETGSEDKSREINELRLINSVNVAINRGDSLDKIIGIISKKLKKLFSFRSIGVFLLSSDFRYLVAKDLVIDPPKKKKVEELTQIKISELRQSLVDGGYYYKALKEGKPLIISGSKDIKKFIGEIYKHKHRNRKVPKGSIEELVPAVYEAIGLKSIMVTPLISDGYEIGVFVATSKKDFTDIDLERVNIVSSQLALAMKRKKMEEDLKEASAKIDQIFDVSVSAIAAIDRDFNVVRVNREFSELFGFGQDDVKGKKCFEVIRVSECKKKDCFLKRIINGEKEIHKKIKKVNKYGSEIIIELTSRPTYDKKGSITGIIEGFKDITPQEEAVEKIKAGEEKLRELFNNMSSGVAVYEPVDGGSDFIIRDFNKAAEEIDKIKREDVIGKSVFEAYPGVKDFGLYDIIKSVYITGKPERHPVCFYKDKRIAGWRRNYIYRLPSGEIVAVYDDLTREKKAEKLLKDSEKFSASLMENSPNPIVVFNSDTSIKYVNMALENIVGIKSDKLAGMKPPYPWWPKKDIKEYWNEFNRIFKGAA
jgi:PAS domain S-box-containing protein